jgi:hypothetical protein
MVTRVDERIVTFLGPDREDLIRWSLGQDRRYRCPVCGDVGDSGREDVTQTVLYHRMAMAGGYSGESSSEGFVPDELMVVRWWLARVHEDCRTGPVLPWSQVPAWARPSQGPDRYETRPLADRVQRSWSASVTVTGEPILRWEPAPMICQVNVDVGGPAGIGRERLVGVVVEEMQVRGAMPLRDRDLVPDAVGDLPMLHGWYAQIHHTAVTVWMPPSQRMYLPPPGGPARRMLCTLDGLPTSWLAAVAAQNRLMLEVTTPTIDCLSADPGGPVGFSLPQRAGGMVAAGTADDEDRDVVGDRLRRRSSPAPPVAALIEVASLWEPAFTQAQRLAAAHNARVPASQAADPDLIALVMVGLSRQDGVNEVGLAAVAQRLADPQLDLVQWLELMIGPTTVVDRLTAVTAAIRRAGRGNLPELAFPQLGWTRAAQDARAAVDRQRLIDAGGLRLGDRARCLPYRGAGGGVLCGEVRAVSTLTWPAATHQQQAWPRTWFEVAVDPPHPHDLEERRILLADDDDPRAAAQAAYCAAEELHTYAWIASVLPSATHDPLRREEIRQRYALHTIAPVRQILQEVRDATDADFDRVVATAILRLGRLAPGYTVPGGVLAIPS